MRSIAPTRVDPIARVASEVVGGPVGRHGRPHPFWVPVRVIVAVATVVACLALVQKGPCIQTDWGQDSVRYGKMCYSDIPYLYTGRGMDERAWPYTDHHGRFSSMEYPVGISYLTWGLAEVLRPFAAGPSQEARLAVPNSSAWGLPGMIEEINQYFLLNSVVLLACLIASAWLLSRAQRFRPWDAMAFAMSPCLLVTALINWDLFAVLLVAAALWAWGRLDGPKRMLVVGALLGAGTAMKLYPLVLLGAVVALGVRRRDWGGTALALGAGAVSWLLINLPAMLTGLPEWKVFWTFNQDRAADLGSLWLLAQYRGATVPATLINNASTLALVTAFVAVVLLTVRAPVEPRLSQIGFLLVAAFLLVNKVYSPQYVLWLLPLAVLARPRWRDLLIWQATELFYFGAVWLYLGQYTASATSGQPDQFYQIAIAVRVIGELYLVAMVVRDILRPEHDEARLNPAREFTPDLARV